MIKVFDCSNSSKRPSHRGGGGSVQNDVMRYLKEYACYHSVLFVSSLNEADVIITNDVFPDVVLDSKKPKVKRMDGVFWRKEDQERNIPYFEASKQADHVIFISNYSKNSYYETFKAFPKNWSIALNWVDPSVFIPSRLKSMREANDNITLSSIATDWNREEKRCASICSFAEKRPNIDFILIGNPPSFSISSNVKSVGYIESNKEIFEILKSTNAFLNLSYKDPAPKVVAQASAIGLPIIYADSGGTSELVIQGAPIRDSCDNKNEYPALSSWDIDNAIRSVYDSKQMSIHDVIACSRYRFGNMIKEYFEVIAEIS